MSLVSQTCSSHQQKQICTKTIYGVLHYPVMIFPSITSSTQLGARRPRRSQTGLRGLSSDLCAENKSQPPLFRPVFLAVRHYAGPNAPQDSTSGDRSLPLGGETCLASQNSVRYDTIPQSNTRPLPAPSLISPPSLREITPCAEGDGAKHTTSGFSLSRRPVSFPSHVGERARGRGH